MENAVSNLDFGGWKIWGGKCYLESPIFGVENLGCKMLSRISNLGGGKFGAENAIANLELGGWKIWGGKCSQISNFGGGKFGVENAISNLEFGGWKFGVENSISNVEKLGWNLEFVVWSIWGGKCYLETPI